MEKCSGIQLAFAVKAYYTHGQSFVRVKRAFRLHYHLPPRSPVPSNKAIRTWVLNFESSGSTSQKIGGSVRTARTPQNIKAVRNSVNASTRTSLRLRSLNLGLSYTTTSRTLHKDLHYHPYKDQIVQALNVRDYPTRLGFCEQMLEHITENDNLLHNLWMSDEAHFHLSRYANKQNFRFWSDNNPRQLHERPLYSEKITVWCAISSLGIIGPYFFWEREGARSNRKLWSLRAHVKQFFSSGNRELQKWTHDLLTGWRNVSHIKSVNGFTKKIVPWSSYE